MKVVFSGGRSDKTKLFAGLAEHLRTNKCASDRDGVWSPHRRAEKAAAQWAQAHGLKHEIKRSTDVPVSTIDIDA